MLAVAAMTPAFADAPTSAPPARADDRAFGPGAAMMQAIGKVVRAGNTVTQRYGSRIGWHDGVAVLGAFVQPGRSSSFRFPLRAGEVYSFIGGGDDDARDVDITVTDDTGRSVATDTDTSADPVVVFRAPRDGAYTVKLELYDAPVASFLALAVLTDSPNRYTVPIDIVVSAMTKSLVQAAYLDRSRGGARYHDADNQWAIFGQVLRQGESMRISNLTMDGRNHTIVAAGDETAQDIDLFVRRSGRLIGADEDKDPIPMVTQWTTAGGGYEIEVKNVRSGGPSLVVATIIE
jgi:hypothetical protein